MKARALLTLALSATVVTGGVACSKATRQQHNADPQVNLKAIACPAIEGVWSFRGETLGTVKDFMFARNDENELTWTYKDLQGVVAVNGKIQQLLDNQSKDAVVTAKCENEVVHMTIKQLSGDMKLEWRASAAEAMGHVTVIRNVNGKDEKAILPFFKVYAPHVQVDQTIDPNFVFPTLPLPELPPELTSEDFKAQN